MITTTLIGALLGVTWAALLAYGGPFERRTGLYWGTYRWPEHSKGGPPPIFGLVLRPGGTDWVRFEVVIAGRTFYLTRWRPDVADRRARG